MKKLLLSAILCLAALSLTACLSDEPDTTTSADSTDSTATAVTTTQSSVHTHSFGQWENVIAATCETDGSARRTCTCGEVEETVLTAKGHKWTAATCTDASVCQNCNTKGDPELGHDLTDGYCNRCKTSFRTQEDVQKILKIVNADIYVIDSAGGVSVDIGWENPGDRTINYIKFTVTALNAVGDPVKCTVRGDYNYTLTQTGPFEAGHKAYSINDGGHYGESEYVWDNVWYNDTAKTIKISRIIIQYADKTEIDLSEEEVAMAFAPMSLSTTAVKLKMDMPQFTISSSDRISELKVGIVSDEGYLIQKLGSATIKLTEVKSSITDAPGNFTDVGVICTKTVALTEDCYQSSYSNELTLAFDTGITKKGMTLFRLDLTLTFDGEEQPLTYSVVGYARVIG